MTTATKAPTFASNTSLPADRVGCVVWWSADDVRIGAGALGASMVQHCPQHADLVRVPSTPRTAMRRAMARRQGAAMEKGWRWEEISDDADGLLIALAQGERDKVLGEYRASTRLTVRVTDAGGVSYDPPSTGAESRAISSLVDRYQTERTVLTQADVRDLLAKVLLRRSKGTRQKSGGAIYFLPFDHDEVVDQLTTPMRLAGVVMKRFPIMRTDSATVGQLVEDARESLADEVATLRAEAEERLAKLKAGDKKPRASVLVDRLQEAQELRQKVRLYQHLLSAPVDDIESALRAVERTIEDTQEALAASTKESA